MNIKERANNVWNKATHNKDGELRVQPILNEIDELTMIHSSKPLNSKQLKKMRPITVAKTATVAAGAVATGVTVGKTAVTSFLLSVGSYIVYDAIVYKPFSMLTDKVTQPKSK